MMKFLFGGKGRVSRKANWLFFIAYVAIHAAAHVIDHKLGWTQALDDAGPLMSIFSILALWPTVAVEAKRFHDRGMSGWWVLWFILLTAAPIALLLSSGFDGGIDPDAFAAGQIRLNATGMAAAAAAALVQIVQIVILLALPGQPGDNRHGPNPVGK